jgi:hypothetical protein
VFEGQPNRAAAHSFGGMMKSTRFFLSHVLAAASILVCLAWAGGCSDNTTSLAPFEPEVSNVADNFSIQATGVRNVTSTLSYTWANSGTRATINHSTTTSSGSAQVVVKDNAGTIVYSKGLMPSLNEPTEVGQPGSWTIELVFSSYSGTLNLLAQKL